MSKVTWLHLSDVHLPAASDDAYRTDKVLDALIVSLREETDRGQMPDMIFFTGDIADKGKDYSKAAGFFDDLLDATNLTSRFGSQAKRRLFIVPGNHDVDQDKTRYLLRPLQTVEQANDFFSPKSMSDRKPYFARFHAYEEFFNSYFDGVRQFSIDQHFYSEVLDLNDIPLRLGVMGLNSAWFCQDHEDERKLWISERVCDMALDKIVSAGSADLIIALHHHPYSWLDPRDRRLVKGLLTERADICLYGHMHELQTEQIKDQHGRVLRLQAGATYDRSTYPYQILWGIINVENCKVRIRPMTYQQGPPRRWTLDPSLFPNKAPDYTEDFDLPNLLRSKTIHLPLSNPIGFFSGNPATEADIANNLDIPRTQYTNDWIDLDKVPQKPWKDLLFAQERSTLRKKKVRIVIIYGHRGSGKTTLCRRMMQDLKASSIPVIDLLDEALSPQHTDSILKQIRASTEACVHVFTDIEDLQEARVVGSLRAAIKQLANSREPLILYVAIDTNKWRQIESQIGRTARVIGCSLESRNLKGQLDLREISDLISRLKEHNCLFRLQHKTDEGIWFAFRQKAKRGLLVSLIEATKGTENAQELADILLSEYQDLSDKAKWAYRLTFIFHAFGMGVPYTVMERALGELTGDQGYFESEVFDAETAEVLYRKRKSLSYQTRHRLVAETLLQHFKDAHWDGFKYRAISAVLRSLDLTIPLHRAFFENILERKVLRIISDLESVIEEIVSGRVSTIQGREISKVLNSVVRIYQSRAKYVEAKLLADISLKHWDHIGNQGFYLRAFCCYYLGQIDESRAMAMDLVKGNDYPFHFLHGIALLALLRAWVDVDKALKDFYKRFGSDSELYPEYERLRRDADIWLSVTWSEQDFETTKPSIAVEKIELLLVDNEADEKTIIAQYQSLTRRQHEFLQGYISFFRYMHRPRPDDDDEILIERYRTLQKECEYHLAQHEEYFRKYPKEILTALHSNLARALFKIDYILKNGYENQKVCARHFEVALTLNPDNSYAHNWYGTFLKDALANWEAARTHYQYAINGNKANPLFKHNLALLFYEAPKFKKELLESAWDLASESSSLCAVSSRWLDFKDYSDELLNNLSLLLARTDLKDGDPLSSDTLLAQT